MKSIDRVLGELQEKLSELESIRTEFQHQKQQAMRWVWLIGGIGAVVSAIGLLALLIPGIILAILTIIVAAIVYSAQVTPLYNRFREKFKRQFIAELLSALTDEAHFVPEGHTAAMQEYFRSELYPRKPDRTHVEDTIFARLGATDIIASEIHTEYKQTTRDKDGKTQVTWHTIFEGLFISADFHKDFRSRTFVRTDLAEKMFGSFGRMFQNPIFSQLQLVQLEDVEFEREFVVHSDDQIEARYILSPALMQRMLELRRKFGSQIEFSFLQSRVFLAISHSKNFFEPDMERSLHDWGYLQSFVEQVQLCLGIVEDLDLNTRLWTKH